MHVAMLLPLIILAADGEFKPDQSKLPVAPPKGAVVLLGEKDNHRFLSMAGEKNNWPIEDGIVTSTPKGNRNHIVSDLHFRDADIHVEFMLPEKGPANSGVYIHGNYEVQILNSHGKEAITQEDAGSLYGFSKPLANACRPPVPPEAASLAPGTAESRHPQKYGGAAKPPSLAAAGSTNAATRPCVRLPSLSCAWERARQRRRYPLQWQSSAAAGHSARPAAGYLCR